MGHKAKPKELTDKERLHQCWEVLDKLLTGEWTHSSWNERTLTEQKVIKMVRNCLHGPAGPHNKAKCLKCGDIIESKHRHDFVTCKCGNISVDGGRDYHKRCFKEIDTWKELP